MKKKTAIQLGVAATLIVAAGIWGRGDQLTSDTVDAAQSQTSAIIPAGTPAAVTQPLQEGQAKIVQSVAELAPQIADNAYNNEKTEALVAAAAAISLRVNTLKAEAMAQAEKTAVATYNKALAEAKANLAEEEARAGLPKEESKTAAPNMMQPYTVPFQRDEAKPVENKPDDFELAQLKAIMATNDLEGYKAILFVGGQERSAREGQSLTGNIRVHTITRNKVVLTSGDKTKTLYLP